MGGYNTICEALATTTPTLVIPRQTPRMEQQIRAQKLADCGLIDMCLLDNISPQRISDWFAMCCGQRVERRGIDLDGLKQVPKLAISLLETKEGTDGYSELSRPTHRVCA
ncbi:hypothetical protein D3C79_925440 [compost metagenome]